MLSHSQGLLSIPLRSDTRNRTSTLPSRISTHGNLLQPIASRFSPNLEQIAALTTIPFRTLDVTSSDYALGVTAIFSTVLAIPLLPNRLSPPILTTLSAQIPFSHIHLLDLGSLMDTTTLTAKIHLVATLQVFVPPRYKIMSSQSISIYFRFLTALLNAIPIPTLNPPPPKRLRVSDHSDSDSDIDDRPPRVVVVTSFAPIAEPPPPPDVKTRKRIASLTTPAHLTGLLAHSRTSLPALIPLLLALSNIWPDVLGSVLAVSPGLMRELYRAYVRSSPLGREGTNAEVLVDPSNTETWAPMLVLVDLYTKALMTMGDDEFFGTSEKVGAPSSSHTLGGGGSAATRVAFPGASAGTVSAWRNPLTLDELVVFSRQLLNIAFVLYLQEGATEGNGFRIEDLVGGAVGGVRCTWEGVREKVTRCLVMIHARE